MVVRVAIGLTGYVFAAGHRLRLSVSPTYWPFAWPSPEPVLLTLRLSAETVLHLPRPPGGASDGPAGAFAAPEQTAPAPGNQVHDTWRTSRYEAATGKAVLESGSDERTRLDAADLDASERIVRTFTLRASDPLTAQVEHKALHGLRREDWEVTVAVRTSMTSSATHFVVARELDAFEGGVRVHAARTVTEIARDGL